MDIFAVAVCALCSVLLSAMLKRSNKEYAILLTLGMAVIILIAVLEKAQPFFTEMTGLSQTGILQDFYFPLLLRAVGITVVGQTAVYLCKDAGETALAYAVGLAAKVGILVVSLPAIAKVFEFLEEILVSIS